MSHPDDVHALVLNRILALPKNSPESHAAHRDYQATRLSIRPKLLAQKALLERAALTEGCGLANVTAQMTADEPTRMPESIAASLAAIDAQVSALDAEIATMWLDLDGRGALLGLDLAP